jgi:rhamnopyranosyl-N-acetylglucosaminyl-diphospho-decaprenol beta-1,3/1,4-galactofuranosyltransferase
LLKVTALVLTYNRKKLIIKTLNALARQSFRLEEIVVVNNASNDGTDRVLCDFARRFPPGWVRIVTFKENIGASGGFAEGMEYILKNSKSEWIWMMDDDAIPEKLALEKFHHFYASLTPQQRMKTGVLLNQRYIDYDKFKAAAIPVEKVYGRLKVRATFEGYLIKREVVRAIGYPRREFFIYSDDIEYTWRVVRRGFHVYRVYGSLIYHKDWAKLDKIYRGIVGKPNIPPWKLYYRFRNAFLVCEDYPLLRFFLMIALSVDLLLWSFINRENAYFAKRGLVDGINLVSGKIISPESLPLIKE